MMRLGRSHAPMRTGSNRVIVLFNASFQSLSICIYFIDGWRKQFGQAHAVLVRFFFSCQKAVPNPHPTSPVLRPSATSNHQSFRFENKPTSQL